MTHGTKAVSVAGLVAFMMVCSEVAADISGFGGFCLNVADVQNPPSPVVGGWQITTDAAGERRSLFHPTPQDITSSFRASFTYQVTNAANNHSGVTLCIQNSATGCNTVGANPGVDSGLGYLGITPSKAVALQLNTPAVGQTSVSICTNGVIVNGESPRNANPLSMHPIRVTIEYDAENFLLNITMIDQVTLGQYQNSFFVNNLANAIGSSTAYVGVTAATRQNTAGTDPVQIVKDFEFVNTPCYSDIVSSATFQPPPDGIVDGADLAYLLGEWGTNPGSIADIVTSATFLPPPDGIVNGADLAYLLGAWGTCH